MIDLLFLKIIENANIQGRNIKECKLSVTKTYTKL